MKLPKETTLWKWAIIGFGLIIGVAVIAVMNLLNDLLNSTYGDPIAAYESGSSELSVLINYLMGKIVSIFTGSFTAGAVIIFLRPDIPFRSLLVTGSIFLLLSLFDMFFYHYPLWYQILSLITPIPSVLFGSFLIKMSLKS
jgi:hypothetical protein